ncbi:hypothetical protein CB0940_07588 [Cercospora beticola]|uniref:Mid2 domain-containing protein n=1 Tax=Cercospora beticola TaxID=122368 RepID=A0A2G5H804_CERBT|nr:hypothetical protein CB0940_07588 [Cercospora beticola]PIA88433.1 hypothetical protein CB0940_07588 [Cercospora beticola]WPB03549.1 hypothetical protein RHO25_008189 [Cercospora beticola]CAK1357709.1 unnamed protein product [Cercospora beticola]
MALAKLLTIAFLMRHVTGETDCFFPNHQRAENFTTCNAGAPHAACCRPEDVCLSNGYCLQQGAGLPNRLIRGGCTDYTFSSSACPAKCADTAQDVPVTIFLARDSRPNGDFCCVSNFNVTSGNCIVPSGGSSRPFSLSPGTVIYDRSTGDLLPENWTATAQEPGVVVASAAGNNVSMGAIIGVAVPLGVLLLAALAGCFILWRQLKKVKAAQGSAHHSGEWSEGKDSRPEEYDYGTAPGYVAVANEKSDRLQHHPELPSPDQRHSQPHYTQQYIAEAPTEGEVQMADSRSVGR